MFDRTSIDVRTSDGRNFVLLTPFSFTSAKDGQIYTVPAGATSDGASTPPELWPTIPPFGKYWLAAFLHDWAYRMSDLPKARCDELLREAMEALQVDRAEADAIYEGVHLFGQSSFDQDREAQLSTEN